MKLFRQLWQGWKKVAHRIGVVQTYILLTVVYFTILPLFVLLAGKRRLRLKLDPTAASYWEPVPPASRSLEDAQRPF